MDRRTSSKKKSKSPSGRVTFNVGHEDSSTGLLGSTGPLSSAYSSNGVYSNRSDSHAVREYKKLSQDAFSRNVYVSKKEPDVQAKVEEMVFQFYREYGCTIDQFRKLVMNIKTRMKFEGNFEDTKKEVEAAIFKKVSPHDVQLLIAKQRKEWGFGEERYLKLVWFLKKTFGHADVLRAMGMIQYLKYHEVNSDSLQVFIKDFRSQNPDRNEENRRKMLKKASKEFGITTEKASELMKDYRIIKKPKPEQINNFLIKLREELGTGEDAYEKMLNRMKKKFELSSMDKAMSMLKRAQGGVTNIEDVRELLLICEAEGNARNAIIE